MLLHVTNVLTSDPSNPSRAIHSPRAGHTLTRYSRPAECRLIFKWLLGHRAVAETM